MNAVVKPASVPEPSVRCRSARDYELARLRGEIAELQHIIARLECSPNALATMNLWCLQAMLNAQHRCLEKLLDADKHRTGRERLKAI